MGLRNKDQPMSYSHFRAGIVWPGILGILIVFICFTAGCIQFVSGNVSSQTDPGSTNALGNDTNTSASSLEFTRSLQGFVARPVNTFDKSIIRSATIPVIRTTNPVSCTGPGLNAKGNDIAMENVTLQTETLDPT